jgi:glycosyltransferase involved in cell wall biosynthesis
MDRLRVLFVTDKVNIAGGGEISLLHLISGLRAAGDLESYLAVPAQGELSARAEGQNIPVIILPQPRVRMRLWRLPQLRRHAVQVIGDIQPDIIHVNNARSMLIAGIAGKRCGIPVVWHVRVEGRDIFDRWLASNCTLIITPSRVVASRYPSADVHVVPNPVEVPETTRIAPAGEQLRVEFQQDDEFLLLAVGELSPRKGHLRTLEALSLLDPALSWRLLIGGREPPDEAGVRERLEDFLGEKGLGDRVQLLGFREDVQELMMASDLLIHSPDREGFGRVFIEAMAVGLPIVVSPVGGLKELHDETDFGWISDDLTPAALARTVELALRSDHERETFRKKGPDIARERYSREMHASRVRDIFLTLLDMGKTDPGQRE